ncbi:MAG TPA: IPT/TIG domain-containing protein, partial [Verrucomicrobiae bacterium]|nr:IPT/TIG domain-containing protein [Verrucomicrobiae bacterium]
TQVTEIDLVAHSIGGLIVRAYLEGLQTNESYLPPYNNLIHNLVMIAVPNFGSFQVGNAANSFEVGSQGAELIPGSALLWNLATWNQRGDDLAGVNAIAVIGNAGQYVTLNSTTTLNNASDGMVSTTSASLGFVVPDPAPGSVNPTRIVPYCQVDPAVFINTATLGAFNCDAPGIANVNSATQESGVIVRSFLAGNTSWESVGTSPSSDEWLSTNGGAFFAMQNVTAGYVTDLTSVTWGNAVMTDGGNLETVYYTDFVSGNAESEFLATSTSLGSYDCGDLAVMAGSFAAYRCKLNTAIACPISSSTCSGAVTPTTTPGRAVTSGSTLTIAGEDFGSECGSCHVYSTPAGATTPTTLSVTSWTNIAISVVLPASLTGYQILQVNGTGGVDSIGVRALAAASSPGLSLGSTSLSFAYTLGGSLPGSQSFTISNSGTGTLDWTAGVESSATWLSLSSESGAAPSTVTVSVDPAALAAGTYTGAITVTASGASNSPATVTVTLVVSAAAASLAVTPTSLTFAYTSGGALPAAQSLTISNGGGGTFTWTASANADWVALSATSGSPPGTLTVVVTPQNLPPGTNNATITVSANGVTPVTVSVGVTVTGTPPAPVITSVANAGSYATNLASATWVAIFGANLSQQPNAYIWQTNDFVNGALPTSLQGVSVTINGIAAYIYYISSTQINVLAPDDPTTGSVPVVVTVAGEASNSFTVQKNAFSPAFLTFPNDNVAAEHLDYSLLGPAGLFPSATTTPASPGETVILYGVGFGPTSPALPTGQIVPPGGEPLANTLTMTIGGVAVTPSFAGLSSSGLYQFNVTVPASLTSGNAAVSATIGGAGTQTGVVLAVQSAAQP